MIHAERNTITVQIGANNGIVPYNAKRVWIVFTTATSIAYYLFPGSAIAPSVGGFRIVNGEFNLTLRASDCGDIVQGPHSIYSQAGSAGTIDYIEGIDDADL